MDTRIQHRPNDSDGLAPHLHARDPDFRRLEELLQPFADLHLELLDGESRSMDRADHRKRDVAGPADPHRLVGNLFRIHDANRNLIVRTKKVGRSFIRRSYRSLVDVLCECAGAERQQQDHREYRSSHTNSF